jgi:hypothetical protein
MLVNLNDTNIGNDNEFEDSQMNTNFYILPDDSNHQVSDSGLITQDNQYGTLLPSPQNGSFLYPRGSSIIPMGNAQNEIQQRMLYKQLYQRIYHSSDVEVIMDDFYYDGVKYPAGTLASMNGFGGDFNYTIAKTPFNVTKGYSLHPRKIAIFKSDVRDGYGQNVTWEEGYFERIFRVYLWGDYFDRINETGIRNDDLTNYDIFIIPSITKGYEKLVEKTLGSKGLNKLRKFVRKGNFLYAQGSGCYLAEAARLVPNGTVNLDTRIDSKSNHADMVAVNSSYPMAHSWLSNRIYVIDDPVLNATDPNAVVAKYTGNLTNSSLINTSAIMAFKAHKGDLVLINGHPSVNSDFYPIFFDAMFYGMAETSDLRATCRQIYNPELPPGLIPAQEANVTVQVEVTYINFWPDTNNSPKTVELNETISAYFYLDETNITPTPDSIIRRNVSYGPETNGSGGGGGPGGWGNGSGGNGSGGNGTSPGNGTYNGTRPPVGVETDIIWGFRDDQGIRKFVFNVKTYENSTKKGVVPVSKGLAKFTPPGFRGREEIWHGWTSISAALAARLVGDRDIELDGCYPLRSSGEYFDIALCLENKEGTTAKNITVVDIVCLKSPIVNVVNQSMVPGAWNNTNNGTNDPVFAINKVFYYYDKNNKPLYPLPNEVYNTTYNYTFWNGTNLTLPALKLVWHIEDLLGYDYLEPAIRYGIYSREEFNRTVSFRSDPVKGSVILNGSGGSVFTNIGIHPIPYHQYLKHGVVSIPKGEELPRVIYKDIWNRVHEMKLRTVFYDIVPFPPPEEHMVVTTTFEMTHDGQRLKEFPIHHDVDLKFKLKTWNGYGKYDPKTYPYYMNITKNETMIVQAIPRGVGYNIDYLDSTYNRNTSLLKMHNTSTHTILYFQQDIAGGHKEIIEINTTLSAYPSVHREGAMKVNDGARFVYHQIAVGPNRYEVFDSHVQAVFGIGNNVNVRKKVAPVYIATFGDDVYHFIRLEDPYEPREFLEDPYIKSHGFGDMAATTYVGGRINETLFHSRVSPGGRTLVRIEVDNNLGYDLENVSLTPVAPEGFRVTHDEFTTQIPPIFFDFPFINRTEIWDAWKSVYYFWVDINSTVEGGRCYQINFTFNSNCSNASFIPSDFEIPPAVIGVKDSSGHVEAIFGRAVNVTLSDIVTSPIVRPEDVRIANVMEKDALELMLATGVARPGIYNRSIVNKSYQTLRGTSFTNMGAGKLDIALPPYAQMLPWVDNNTNAKTLYVIVRTNVTVNRGGTYTVNKGPAVSYVNHFNETVKIKGNNEYIEAHGPAFYYKMNVMSISTSNGPQGYLTGGENNTVRTRVKCYNWGDDIAQSSTMLINLPSTVALDITSLPAEARILPNSRIIQWKLGDIGPGSEKAVEFEFFTTPPKINFTPNRGPPDPWLLINHAKVKFIHGFLKKPVTAQPSESLFGYLYDSDMKMSEISYSHPFAATNYKHTIYAYVTNNWAFSDTIHNIKVNFSVDGVYAGTGTIPSLYPGWTLRCGINLVFNKEGTYKIKATIVGPELNEFYDTNNELERSLIVVDPVTLEAMPDFGTGTDTFVSNLDAKLTFGDQYNMKVGKVSSSGGSGSGIGVSRSYLQFDATGIPDNAIVIDAKLNLYQYKSVGNSFKISTYRVNGAWTEGNTTFNRQPILNATLMSSTIVGSSAGYKSWDVTAAVQAWVVDPARNHGLMLKSDVETVYRWKEFYSSDSENGLRPQLVVKYAMLKNTPNIKTTKLTINDHLDRELRLEWKPVPYALYYEIYKASDINGPFTKLGTTWDGLTNSWNGSLDTFFYDDVDGGYPEPPAVITTDRGGLPGTIRVLWDAPASPAPSAQYYYRIKAIGIENRNSDLKDSPTEPGQLTPEVEKYMIYSSTSYNGPWTNLLVETENLQYSHSGLGPGKVMYYRLKSVSTESFKSTLSKIVWGRSNRPPTISDLTVKPDQAYTTDYLLVDYTFTDLDGDTESGSQIRWYRDGNLVSWYNDRTFVYPVSTKKGQVWYYTVNPGDGIEFGTIATSGMRTILNSPPKLNNIKILPIEPVTTDNLTISYTYNDADSDPETTANILWYRDGVLQSNYNDQKLVPLSATKKGEVWNATICVGDGSDFSPWYQISSVTIKNSQPVAVNAYISPSDPMTTDALNAIYSYSDADLDPESGTEINWYRNDQLQVSFVNKAVVPATATQKGDTWYFTVKPSDGDEFGIEITSKVVKIGNTKPIVTELKLYPEEPRTMDTLYIEYTFFDSDSDPEIDSEIKWYRDGNYIEELFNAIQVPPSFTVRGQSWKFSITPKDGYAFGDTVFSDPVVVINTPPEIVQAQIEPIRPAVNDELKAKYSELDADEDQISQIQVTWFKDSIRQTELDGAFIVPTKYTRAGESWYFEIQVSDGTEFGAIFKTESVKINIPPVATELLITPSSPTSSDGLEASYIWFDENGDEESETLLQWFRNDQLIEELTNSLSIPVDETIKGDVWHFKVTPGDGLDSGDPVISDSVIIGNTPPTASEASILRSDEQGDEIYVAAYNYYDLDSDPEQEPKIQWFRNDKQVPALSDSKGITREYLTKDDVWYFMIAPFDGKDYGVSVRSGIMVIENVAPVVKVAIINPELPTTTNDLEAYIEYFDPDSDTVEDFQPEFKWYKNDKVQSTANGWEEIPASLTTKGEVWYFTIRLYDGIEWSPEYKSTPVTIQNSIPEVSKLSLTPARPTRISNIDLEYIYSDLDGDVESGTLIQWFRNGELVSELNDKTTVTPDYLSMGHSWFCTVQPNDGTDHGEILTSETVTVNIVPSVVNVMINPVEPSTNDKLKLSYDYSDPEGDSQSNSVIRWYINDQHVAKYDGLTKIPADELKAEDKWYATVQPSDGLDIGFEAKSNEVIILPGSGENADLGSGDNIALFIIVVILVIFIILALLMLITRRRTQAQHETVMEVEPEYEAEPQREYRPEPVQEMEPKPRAQIESDTETSKAIPLAVVVKNLPKHQNKIEIELVDENELLPYDQIDIEFKCPRCDMDIEADLDVCPECGEEFGSIR